MIKKDEEGKIDQKVVCDEQYVHNKDAIKGAIALISASVLIVGGSLAWAISTSANISSLQTSTLYNTKDINNLKQQYLSIDNDLKQIIKNTSK